MNRGSLSVLVNINCICRLYLILKIYVVFLSCTLSLGCAFYYIGCIVTMGDMFKLEYVECCNKCAFHKFLHTKELSKAADEIISNIKNDCFEFFDDNFEKTDIFCCYISLMASRLVIHNAFNIIRFIYRNYPNMNVDRCMRVGLRRVLTTDKRNDAYVSSKRSIKNILQFYDYFLRDNTIKIYPLPEPEWVLAMGNWAKFLVYALYKFNKPDINYFLECRDEPSSSYSYQMKYDYCMQDIRWGMEVRDNTLQIPLNVYKEIAEDDVRELKVLLFSQRALQILYLVLVGCSYRNINLSALAFTPDTEIVQIVSAFNSTLKLSLFDICRRTLFKSFRSHNDLEKYMKSFELPQYLLDRFFLRSIDIRCDCESLQMTTLSKRYDGNADLMFDDYALSYNYGFFLAGPG